MLSGSEIFKIGFTIVQGAKVFVVALETRESVHDFTVHFDSVNFAVAVKSTAGVEAALRTNEPPVMAAQKEVVVVVNDGKDTLVKKYTAGALRRC
jgi:hypothetical protein